MADLQGRGLFAMLRVLLWVLDRLEESGAVAGPVYDIPRILRDRMVFKVPTLRNVAETGPYFHDGHVATLEEAVRLMGLHEAGTHLSDADVHSIVTFLHALTGEIPQGYIQPPAPKPTAISYNQNHRPGATSNSAPNSMQGGE